MKKASISTLKAHLSRYLDAVKSGEEIIVTDRGRPVARLSALDPGAEVGGRIARLVREGRVRAPVSEQAVSEGLAGRLATPLAADPDGVSLKALLDERSTGR